MGEMMVMIKMEMMMMMLPCTQIFFLSFANWMYCVFFGILVCSSSSPPPPPPSASKSATAYQCAYFVFRVVHLFSALVEQPSRLPEIQLLTLAKHLKIILSW